MFQALYRKWRPVSWDQVVGQEHVVQTLRNAVAANRVAHAYLFAGPRGTGKTTSARLLAKAVNCLDEDPKNRPCNSCQNCVAVNEGRFLDLIEIDAASNTSVEDVRELRDKINFSPNQGDFKIYLIDEVHMLSTAAFNALLKTLEEPPAHAIFILATTESHKIPATVSSRCQQHEFRRISNHEIKKHLEAIVEAEGIKAEPEALALVARQATGAMRDAISLMDQLASTGDVITRERTEDMLGTATSQAVIELVDALVGQDAAAGLELIHRGLDGGADPRQFSRQMVDYLRDVLLVRMGSGSQVEAGADTRARMAQHAQSLEPTELLRIIAAFNRAATESRSTWQPSLPLELAFVESIEAPVPAAAEPSPAPVAASRPARPPKAASAKKAPARPSTPPPATDLPSDGSLSVAVIREKWPSIKLAVRRHNTSTQGVLNSSAILELKGSELILGFASETLKEIMDRPANLEAAQAGLKDVLGQTLRVRCVISADGRTVPPDVEGDGMVATAVRLGGKIVDSTEVEDGK
jgi:DNA polymerase-3 subunit gamma/tau